MARLYIDGKLQVGIEVQRPPDVDAKERSIPLVWDSSVGYRAVIVDKTGGYIDMWSPVIYLYGQYPEARVICARTWDRYNKEIQLAEMLLGG